MRAFQAPQTYEDLTCIEDVLLSTSDRRFTGITPAWFARPWMLRHEHARWDNAVAALDRVGLADLARSPRPGCRTGSAACSSSRARWPRTRASCSSTSRRPGSNAAETDALGDHLRTLRSEGVSILLVDHKLDFITSLCDRVAVLELGTLVAVGPAGDGLQRPARDRRLPRSRGGRGCVRS